MIKTRVGALTLILLSAVVGAGAQTVPLSQQMAVTAATRVWVDSPNGPGVPPKWLYDYGVILNGLKTLWYATGDRRYFDTIKQGVDTFVSPDGTIKTYTVGEYNLDQVRMGSAVLMLYRVTGEAKYKKAADLVRSQLKTHPRTNEGGFWHKKIYPYQMWLDGLYMGEPFYAEYSHTFGEDNWDDITNQFIWMEKHVRDDKTGLLYHAWDESKKMPWADKTTGRAPMFWGRAIGWYAMAIVDVLDFLPRDHPKRPELIAILNRTMTSLKRVQDKSGTWWLILDMPGREKNYLEASASCMFTYAMAKGIRMGYLPVSYVRSANAAWAGIQQQFLDQKDGALDLQKTIGGAGLGGNPYRDGTFNYYVGERVVTNDPKGIGAFLLAAVEMEMMPNLNIGRGKRVVLDDHFNHEVKKDDNGRDIFWHYKWDEIDNGGFSLWGNIFQSFGASLATLSTAPSAANLSNANVYIIVDPDNEKESAKPNFVEPDHVKAIADWVKRGGVLVLMGNDVQNAELEKFNTLAKPFGIQFNKDRKFEVINNDYKMGGIDIAAGNEIFKNTERIFVKEISTLALTRDARAVVSGNGEKVMAISKYGKGTVFAIGDPWLYNEYVDGRRLPTEFENCKAAQDLSRWLLAQSK
jgi:unsaturated rhamnogalacturonyl hydrolase